MYIYISIYLSFHLPIYLYLSLTHTLFCLSKLFCFQLRIYSHIYTVAFSRIYINRMEMGFGKSTYIHVVTRPKGKLAPYKVLRVKEDRK